MHKYSQWESHLLAANNDNYQLSKQIMFYILLNLIISCWINFLKCRLTFRHNVNVSYQQTHNNNYKKKIFTILFYFIFIFHFVFQLFRLESLLVCKSTKHYTHQMGVHHLRDVTIIKLFYFLAFHAYLGLMTQRIIHIVIQTFARLIRRIVIICRCNFTKKLGILFNSTAGTCPTAIPYITYNTSSHEKIK